VLLSLCVPGFGLVRARRFLRGFIWFFALYLANFILGMLLVWRAVPMWGCYFVMVLVFAGGMAMLIDSFRPGELTLPLVALFIALLVVTAILPSPARFVARPFKIPTGAMQPTLNGIIGHPGDEPAPRFSRRMADYFLYSRKYIDVVSQQDDELLQVQPRTMFFVIGSRLIFQHQSILVNAPPDVLRNYFNVFVGRRYRAGEIIARGAVDGGDKIFVDEVSYRLGAPRRGDLVVFRTTGIAGIQEEAFYVKRLAGLPGDSLRIDPPRLYVNGQLAEGPGFKLVMSMSDGYRGYAWGRRYLEAPRSEFRVPPDSYFVLGDNSYNSYDSRYWGCVPAANIVGRVARIYFPLSRAAVPP
jgi:signal peptidase I